MLEASRAVIEAPRPNLPGRVADAIGPLLLDDARVGQAAPTAPRARQRPTAAATELVLELEDERVVDARPGDVPAPAQAPGRRTRYVRLSDPSRDLSRVPPRLAAALAEAGLEVDGYRMAVEDRARYRTQKVVVRLTPPGASTATVVVKLCRDADDSHRLENEARTLTALARWRSPLVPRLLAAGHLDGRAFVALPVLDGVPLRDLRDPVRAADAFADVAAWTSRLAATSVHPAPDDTARVLADLLVRFERAFRPDRHVRARLRADVERLGTTPFPAVVCHGDLGTWNVVVGDGGRPWILDWEAGERHGPPLWDLFHLHRAHVLDRTPGGHPLDTVRDRLLGDGPLADAHRDAVAATLEVTGTPASLVPALFRACWVHRAVKASTRRSRPRRRRGYAQLALAMGARSDRQLERDLVGDLEGRRCAS